ASNVAIASDNLRLHYERSGAGPALILLAGGLATSSSWGELPKRFAATHTVIAVDHRGHGGTPNPAETMSYGRLAEDVVRLVSQLRLRRPAIIGWSDGGQTAIELVIRYPTLCSAIVVCGVLPRVTEELRSFTRELLCLDSRGQVDFDRREAEHPRRLAEMRSTVNPRSKGGWKAVIQQVANLWLTDYGLTPDRLRRIETPTLICLGDHDVVRIEEAAEMFRTIERSELCVFPGADHDVPVTRFGIFAETVLDFLTRWSPE
ncbi:MAG TPA: alpha/beta hydrolase, partial [Chloroflexota bacterium]|nr:alpha/beta hydrolase [Chloroflexota bacterium]